MLSAVKSICMVSFNCREREREFRVISSQFEIMHLFHFNRKKKKSMTNIRFPSPMKKTRLEHLSQNPIFLENLQHQKKQIYFGNITYELHVIHKQLQFQLHFLKLQLSHQQFINELNIYLQQLEMLKVNSLLVMLIQLNSQLCQKRNQKLLWFKLKFIELLRNWVWIKRKRKNGWKELRRGCSLFLRSVHSLIFTLEIIARDKS